MSGGGAALQRARFWMSRVEMKVRRHRSAVA